MIRCVRARSSTRDSFIGDLSDASEALSRYFELFRYTDGYWYPNSGASRLDGSDRDEAEVIGDNKR